MTINDVLKSRRSGMHFRSLMQLTEGYEAYPGRLPARLETVRKTLGRLESLTADGLDEKLSMMRSMGLPAQLSPEERYMLRQRLDCALDFLVRLRDSLPSDGYLRKECIGLAEEDHWLLVGAWRQYGRMWLHFLAERVLAG